jgi:thiamine transport system substrate-binding protein
LRTHLFSSPFRRALMGTAAATVALATLTACGSDDGDTAASESTPTTSPTLSGEVTLVTYDSFALSKKTLKKFEADTGVEVKVLQNGDAGKMVNTAVLTKNRPQGDVMFGVDSTFLSKAINGGIFAPYVSPELANVEAAYKLDGEDRVTPVDHGEVCVNYDKTWYAEKNLTPPASFEDLAKPEYKDQLVVQNPATSSPGLSFLMATVAQFGEDGWEAYWQQLVDNDVDVQPGWDEAYYNEFTAGGGDGPKPLVVSYSSSPAAAVDFAEEELDDAPTAVIESTCFGTVEYAGVLDGAKNPDAAKALVDFLIGETVQADIPPNMYVYPVRTGTPLPESFTLYAKPVVDPLTLDAGLIDANRESWTRTWQQTVLG